MGFTLWPNFILLVCACVVAGIAGFVIYGSIVGFDNAFKDLDENQGDAPERVVKQERKGKYQ